MLRGVPELCCQSFLWERSIRDNVTDNKISEQVAYRILTTRNVIHSFSVIIIALFYANISISESTDKITRHSNL